MRQRYNHDLRPGDIVTFTDDHGREATGKLLSYKKSGRAPFAERAYVQAADGGKIHEVMPESVRKRKWNPRDRFYVYGKFQGQRGFKAMDINEGVQVGNTLRATVLTEEQATKFMEKEAPRNAPEWEFKLVPLS